MGKRARTAALGLLLASAVPIAAAPTLAQDIPTGSEASYDAIADRADIAFATYDEQGATAAEPLFAAIAADIRALLGPDHPEAIVALSNHAFMLLSLNRFTEAETLYAEVEARSHAVLGDLDPGTLQAIADHAMALENAGRAAEAEPLYLEALEGRRAVLGERDPATLLSLNNYGLGLSARGRFAEAEPVLAEAMRLQREVFGPDHPDAILMQTNYAYVLLELGRGQEAEPLVTEAVAANRRVLGDKHPQTLKALNNLAEVQRQNGKLQAAFVTISEVLQGATEQFGRSDPFTLRALSNYATQMSELGLSVQAEALLVKGLAIASETYGASHPLTLLLANNHASILSALGRGDEAAQGYAEVLRLRRQVQGERHPETLNALNNYGIQLLEQGRLAEAAPIALESYLLSRDVLGERHPATLLRANNLALVQRDTGRPRDAVETYRGALAISREVRGGQHPDTLRIMHNLAFALEDIGEFAEAAQLSIDVLQGRRQLYGDRHPDTLDSFLSYGELLETVGRTGEAETFLVDSLRLRREVQGDSHPETLNHAANLAALYLDSTDTPGRALETARLVVRERRARDDALGGTPQGDAQLARDGKSRSFYFKLLAEAAWSAQASDGNEPAALRAEAFTTLQDVLAGSASRAIAQSAARRAAEQAGGLGELARERQELADRWLALEAQFNSALTDAGPAGEERRAGLRQQQAAVTARMAEIDERLRLDAPDYFALIRPQPLAETAAMALLRDDEAALMLVPTRWGTHIMAVTAKGVTWHRSAWTEKQVDAAVTRLLWDVGANVDVDAADADQWMSQGEGAYPYDFTTAAALHGELIAPLDSVLAGKSHVFVMASGLLSALPLGLLVSTVPTGPSGAPETLRGADWLADRFALLQVPSLQSIAFLRDFRAQDASSHDQPFIGFGNPVLAGEATTRGARGTRGAGTQQGGFAELFAPGSARGGKGMADIGQLKAMSSLPGTAQELTAMWEAFGKPSDALHLAGEASEPAVRAADLDASVIAFATHGLLAGEIGGTAEPGLVLTPPDQPSEDNDGYLAMSEIAGLRMNADWVILSACNTAAGDGSDGASGLSGLARAFFYAGARNLLASYWPVRDDVSARLTVRTVEIARANPTLTRAQAFQQAMREIREDPQADSASDTWAHPNAWAPFVFVGDR